MLTNVITNATICVTADMVLSSTVELTYLNNILIIGYNYPTVHCGYSGGLHFASCHNVTIEGIVWNKCGMNPNVSTTVTSGTGLYIYIHETFIFKTVPFRIH